MYVQGCVDNEYTDVTNGLNCKACEKGKYNFLKDSIDCQ